MLKTKNKKTFKIILSVTSIIIAICAAYYSIFGLSKLFSSAKTEVIIMASALELGKLISVSFLYRYWKEISLTLKTYLLIAVTCLMIITSLGIYGFLTSSYQNTITQLNTNNAEIEIIENKQKTFETKIKSLNDESTQYNNRLTNLITLRSGQEERIDKLLESENFYTARKVQADVKRADSEIEKLNKKIEDINNTIFSYRDSISVYDIKIMEEQDIDLAGELGPLLYLSDLTDVDMNIIINYFVLLIVIVFDPLAVALVIAYNYLNSKDENIVEQTIPTKTPITLDIKKNNEIEIDNEDEIKKEDKEDTEKNKKIKYNEENDVLVFDNDSEEQDEDIEEEKEKKEIENKNVFDEFEENLSDKEKLYINDENPKRNYDNVTKI